MHGNFSGAPITFTWYPAALANKLAGTDLNGSTAKITANFNSSFSSWYFGTDGITPSNKYDFVTVVLHELGHGLGFFGAGDVDASGNGTVRYSGYPIIYDRYTADSSGTPLLNYTDASAALGTALKTIPVYFTGTYAKAANANANVRLYAPSTWIDGSS